MKKLLCLFCLSIGIFSGQINAQTDDPEQEYNQSVRAEQMKKASEENLKKIFRLVEGRNYSGFAQNMAYSGTDPNRQLRVPVNYNDPYERLSAENTLNLVHSWIKKSILYHYTNFRIIDGVDTKLCVWDVEFTTHKGKVFTHKFTLSPYDDKYLLARIDK